MLEEEVIATKRKGTKVTFIPDEAIFKITNTAMSM
jgi:DNA gyrase/topoisomerase IV subunit B